MPEPRKLHEAVSIEAPTPKADDAPQGQKGVYKVILLREGPGNPRDKHFYTAEAINKGATVFNGLPCYIDHPDTIEEEARPERSVRDMCGWYENSHPEEEQDTGKSLLCADLITIPGRSFDWVRSLLDGAILKKARDPQGGDLVGLSINATGITTPTDVGGEEWHAVSQFVEAKSCDLVTQAGAGGRIVELKESMKRALQEGRMTAVQVKDVIDALKKMNDTKLSSQISELEKIYADSTHEDIKSDDDKGNNNKDSNTDSQAVGGTSMAEKQATQAAEAEDGKMAEVEARMGEFEKRMAAAEAYMSAQNERETEAEDEQEDEGRDSTAVRGPQGGEDEEEAEGESEDEDEAFAKYMAAEDEEEEEAEEEKETEDADANGADGDVADAVSALQGLDNLPDDVQSKVDSLVDELQGLGDGDDKDGEDEEEVAQAEAEDEDEAKHAEVEGEGEDEEEAMAEDAVGGDVKVGDKGDYTKNYPSTMYAKKQAMRKRQKQAKQSEAAKPVRIVPKGVQAAVAERIFRETIHGKRMTTREKMLAAENAKLTARLETLKESQSLRKLLEKNGIPQRAWGYWSRILIGLPKDEQQAMIDGFRAEVTRESGTSVRQLPKVVGDVRLNGHAADLNKALALEGVPMREVK